MDFLKEIMADIGSDEVKEYAFMNNDDYRNVDIEQEYKIAMESYHAEYDRLLQVIPIADCITNDGACVGYMVALETLYPDCVTNTGVTVSCFSKAPSQILYECAVESLQDIFKRILDFIMEHIGVIIRIIMAIVVMLTAKFGYDKIKEKITGPKYEDVIVAYKEAVAKHPGTKPSMKDLNIDTTKAEHMLRELNISTGNKLAEDIIKKANNCSANALFDSAIEHLDVSSVMLEKFEQIVRVISLMYEGEVKNIVIHDGIANIRDIYLDPAYDIPTIPYSLKSLLAVIGNFHPEINNGSEMTPDVKFVLGEHEAFWGSGGAKVMAGSEVAKKLSITLPYSHRKLEILPGKIFSISEEDGYILYPLAKEIFIEDLQNKIELVKKKSDAIDKRFGSLKSEMKKLSDAKSSNKRNEFRNVYSTAIEPNDLNPSSRHKAGNYDDNLVIWPKMQTEGFKEGDGVNQIPGIKAENFPKVFFTAPILLANMVDPFNIINILYKDIYNILLYTKDTESNYNNVLIETQKVIIKYTAALLEKTAKK